MPPRWSARDWLEEMQAEGAAVTLRAVRDYRPEHNVPLEVYLRMRVLGAALARYRKEWSYALRQVTAEPPEVPGGRGVGASDPGPSAMREELVLVLGRLRDRDRGLLHRLYWRGETEAEAARAMGLSQQAINKRKWSILNHLRRQIDILSV